MPSGFAFGGLPLFGGSSLPASLIAERSTFMRSLRSCSLMLTPFLNAVDSGGIEMGFIIGKVFLVI